ncbi:MAG: imidazole glycerol phosphate synthase subunit HisF [Gammaproteobacteria bacterium]|nr:imidazole glycerol phosphate synthase subunit HisF [Gammaproteobacteria bacterium]MXW08979.1 imidazole glycerol phosphate synthase subunit HisF [Gammaproteobacteria bacterium]MYC50854.1 imidazole glycerol phosphate synthase subunit HisF [Gammaproteobacteria bacterium]
MLRPRIVVCLDVRDGRVVKGTRFVNLRDVGDPVELAGRYEADGADEVVFLDITASHEGRATLLDTVRRTAEALFIPLTVGGGVGTVDDVGALLRAGADKVSVNSALAREPELAAEAAARYGSQCLVASVDAAREGDGWRVYTHGGRLPRDLDAVEWAAECARRGAGEILLTSIDRDGSRIGYDLELTRQVASRVSVPVVASGGGGSAEDVLEVLTAGEASAALLAGILHDGVTTVTNIKSALKARGMSMRASNGAERSSQR